MPKTMHGLSSVRAKRLLPRVALTFTLTVMTVTCAGGPASVAPQDPTAEESAIYPQLGLTWEPRAVGFTPDGSRLIGCDYSGKIAVWATASGRLLQQMSIGTSPFHTTFDVSPDGKRLLAGGGRGATLYEIETGRQLRVYDFSSSNPNEDIRVALLADGVTGLIGKADGNMELSTP